MSETTFSISTMTHNENRDIINNCFHKTQTQEQKLQPPKTKYLWTQLRKLAFDIIQPFNLRAEIRVTGLGLWGSGSVAEVDSRRGTMKSSSANPHTWFWVFSPPSPSVPAPLFSLVFSDYNARFGFFCFFCFFQKLDSWPLITPWHTVTTRDICPHLWDDFLPFSPSLLGSGRHKTEFTPWCINIEYLTPPLEPVHYFLMYYYILAFLCCQEYFGLKPPWRRRCTDLIQRVAEELCSSYFDVEEQEVHVHSLPARNLTDQALLWKHTHTHTHRWLTSEEEQLFLLHTYMLLFFYVCKDFVN